MSKRRAASGCCKNVGTLCLMGLTMVLILYDIMMHAALPRPASRLPRAASVIQQVRRGSQYGAQLARMI